MGIFTMSSWLCPFASGSLLLAPAMAEAEAESTPGLDGPDKPSDSLPAGTPGSAAGWCRNLQFFLLQPAGVAQKAQSPFGGLRDWG